ncbi:MAG: Carbohydrate binding domain (family 25) [Firmicutes bacterium]|nr:Carbohydrate binding domain (family 25) [Bacillota bacterium]
MLEIEYLNNGVTLTPAIPSPYDDVELAYSGLLAKNGATEIFAHVGFDNAWTSASDYIMTKSEYGYKAKIYIPSNAEFLKVCFKDAANNWDNNSGNNYSFLLSIGDRKDLIVSDFSNLF